MPKFQIELSRRFWQYETLSLEIDARTAGEAKRIARDRLRSDETVRDGNWDSANGDMGYDGFDVQVDE